MYGRHGAAQRVTRWTGWTAAALALWAPLLSNCGDGHQARSGSRRPVLTRLDPPAAEGAMAPRLARLDDGALLTWLEPEGDGHRLLVARLDVEREAWSAPRTIVAGNAFFANWADVPGAAQVGGGELWAHWLEKLGDDTYAYGARIARSGDRGESWEDRGLLHDDASPTEHGFVSYVALPGGLRAFWLDGREMEQRGPMQLRTTRLDGGTPAESVLLDDRVCECCSTDAAMTSKGAIVVYRDRSAAAVRDVAFVVVTESGFTEPALVHPDGWHIGGCPVNGPAVDAAEDTVVVAWFTGAEEARASSRRSPPMAGRASTHRP